MKKLLSTLKMNIIFNQFLRTPTPFKAPATRPSVLPSKARWMARTCASLGFRVFTCNSHQALDVPLALILGGARNGSLEG